MAKAKTTVKIKVRKLQTIRAFCTRYVNAAGLSQFAYACKRTVDNADSILKPIDQSINDKREEFALQRKGVYVLDKQGNIQVQSKHIKELRKFIEKEYDKEIEFTTYIAKSLTPEIEKNLGVLELLNGVVLDVDIEKLIEKAEAKRLKKSQK